MVKCPSCKKEMTQKNIRVGEVKGDEIESTGKRLRLYYCTNHGTELDNIGQVSFIVLPPSRTETKLEPYPR